MRTTSQPHISTVGQVVKTLPFHGSIRSSILLRCIKVNLVTLDALISLSEFASEFDTTTTLYLFSNV